MTAEVTRLEPVEKLVKFQAQAEKKAQAEAQAGLMATQWDKPDKIETTKIN
jgi:hypothetical protein